MHRDRSHATKRSRDDLSPGTQINNSKTNRAAICLRIEGKQIREPILRVVGSGRLSRLESNQIRSAIQSEEQAFYENTCVQIHGWWWVTLVGGTLLRNVPSAHWGRREDRMQNERPNEQRERQREQPLYIRNTHWSNCLYMVCWGVGIQPCPPFPT